MHRGWHGLIWVAAGCVLVGVGVLISWPLLLGIPGALLVGHGKLMAGDYAYFRDPKNRRLG